MNIFLSQNRHQAPSLWRPNSSKVEQFVIRRYYYHNSFFLFLSAFLSYSQPIICLHRTSCSLTPTSFLSSVTSSMKLLSGLPPGLLSAYQHQPQHPFCSPTYIVFFKPLCFFSKCLNANLLLHTVSPWRKDSVISSVSENVHLSCVSFSKTFSALTSPIELQSYRNKTVGRTGEIWNLDPNSQKTAGDTVAGAAATHCSALAMYAYAVLFRAHRCFAPFQLFRRWE